MFYIGVLCISRMLLYFISFFIHLSSFFLGDRVPAALRRPRKKHDPVFFSGTACLRRFGDLEKTTFLDFVGVPTHFRWARPVEMTWIKCTLPCEITRLNNVNILFTVFSHAVHMLFIYLGPGLRPRAQTCGQDLNSLYKQIWNVCNWKSIISFMYVAHIVHIALLALFHHDVTCPKHFE